MPSKSSPKVYGWKYLYSNNLMLRSYTIYLCIGHEGLGIQIVLLGWIFLISSHPSLKAPHPEID